MSANWKSIKCCIFFFLLCRRCDIASRNVDYHGYPGTVHLVWSISMFSFSFRLLIWPGRLERWCLETAKGGGGQCKNRSHTKTQRRNQPAISSRFDLLLPFALISLVMVATCQPAIETVYWFNISFDCVGPPQQQKPNNQQRQLLKGNRERQEKCRDFQPGSSETHEMHPGTIRRFVWW